MKLQKSKMLLKLLGWTNVARLSMKMVRDGHYFSSKECRFWTKVAEICKKDKLWFPVDYLWVMKAHYKHIFWTQTISMWHRWEKLIHYQRRKKDVNSELNRPSAIHWLTTQTRKLPTLRPFQQNPSWVWAMLTSHVWTL